MTNGGHKVSINPGTFQVDQAAQGVWNSVVNVGTSEENITPTDITTEGLCVMHNLDSTNYVTWGQDNSSTMQPIGRLEADSWCFLRLEPGETIRAQANTAACDVDVYIFED